MAVEHADPPKTTRPSAHLDRFGALLAVTIGVVVLLALVDLSDPDADLRSQFGVLVATMLVGATFLLALRASGVTHGWRLTADILVGIGLAITTIVYVSNLTAGTDFVLAEDADPSVVFIALAVLSPILVVRRLLQHRRVGSETVLGAISAYLLIALAANLLFLSTASWQSEPFFGSPEPSTSFMYFSLITITTLGYGDLTPVTSLGRLLAAGEAIVGQVFLVTFVAMIVGLFAQDRSRSPLE